MFEQKAQLIETMRRQQVGEGFPPLAKPCIDGRAMLVVWFVFVLSAVSVPKFAIGTVIAFSAFPFFVIVACSLPALEILKRIMMVSPFILMVAAANPFFDTRPVFEISGLPVTAGMISAAVIVLKALVSVAAVLTLVELLSFNVICESLLRMGVPEVFTTQLMLVYRYAFLLTEEAQALDKARELRSFDGKGRGVAVVSKMLGSLLVRSVSRSDRVYKAMLARGYSGTLTYGDDKGIGAADVVFAVSVCAVFLLVRMFV